jgi:hypothetical protein
MVNETPHGYTVGYRSHLRESSHLTCGFAGALGGIRTPNLLIRSQMLYPLSYERSRLAESNGSPPHL